MAECQVTNKLSDYIQGYTMNNIGRFKLRKRDIFFHGWLLVYRNEYKSVSGTSIMKYRNVHFFCYSPLNAFILSLLLPLWWLNTTWPLLYYFRQFFQPLHYQTTIDPVTGHTTSAIAAPGSREKTDVAQQLQLQYCTVYRKKTFLWHKKGNYCWQQGELVHLPTIAIERRLAVIC